MSGFTPFVRGKKPSRPQGCRSALIIVDIQNDFMTEKGAAAYSTAVTNAGTIVATINLLRHKVSWDLVATTQDWHPEAHVSFLGSHIESGIDAKHYDTINVEGKDRVVWPDHCIQGSVGAQLHGDLASEASDVLLRKGTKKGVYAYSAFRDDDGVTKTPLAQALAQASVTDVYVCGVGLEGAVANTAMDAVKEGYKAHVVVDLAPSRRAVTAKSRTIEMEAAGVIMISSSVILEEREDRRQLTADYMEEHNINLVFQKLCSSLVFYRPENPKEFLVREIQKIQKGRRGELSRLTLLHDEDLETMFNLLDPTGKGVLPAGQVVNAMKGLGLAPASKVSPEDKFNVTKFKQLLLAAK